MTSSDRIRLIVIFGGQSAERDISCLTAAHVLRAVDPSRYEVRALGIASDGSFVSVDAQIESPSPSTGTSEVKPLVPEGKPTSLTPILAADTPCEQTVVLPLLHGPLGEDGTMQGLLELADVAYVGAGVLGSAVAMDKAMTKTVLDAHGIPQTRWASYTRYDGSTAELAAQIHEAIGLPCFIKPANMGSSIGVGRATSITEIEEALQTAFAFDELVVVEEAVTAREIEFAVLGNQELRISVPGEIKPAADFYDYQDKYFDGAAELLIPAEVPEEDVARMRDLAERSYRALRVEGMARADFLYEESGRGPLLNELNTIPGFTPISMYPKLWEASGLGYAELIDELVALAVDRYQRRSTTRGASSA